MTSPMIFDPHMFVRTKDRDGYLRSICKGCFLTVAVSRTEAELDRMEKLHACSGLVGVSGKPSEDSAPSSPR